MSEKYRPDSDLRIDYHDEDYDGERFYGDEDPESPRRWDWYKMLWWLMAIGVIVGLYGYGAWLLMW